MIEELLQGNSQFNGTVFKENIDRYRGLVPGQSPKVLWIGCSDLRIQTGHITKTPGHARYP